MNGIDYRLKEFIRPHDGRCLIVDTSAGMALGTLPGLEDFEQGVRPILSVIDGLVCSPGMLPRLRNRSHRDAALLVRADWSNALRGPDFVLPPATPRRLPILTPSDALDLGAAAMVATFWLGYDEELEAACVQSTVQWALDGKAIGLPLVVEVNATGPRVSVPDKAIELGASYALEAGADVIAISYPGRKSLETIAAFVSVPWLVKPTSLQAAPSELDDALALGGGGAWLDHSVFAAPDPAAVLAALARLAARVHPGVEASPPVPLS